MSGLLNGRLALVTGGGSGIGRAVCQLFAKEGAKVIVADVNAGAAQETVGMLEGTGHMDKSVDVGTRSSVVSLLSTIQEKFKRPPSIAVNCAGITRDGFMLKMDDANFDEVLRVNLKGTYLVTQAVTQAMISENIRDGSVVNIGSISGKYGNVGQCNYAASKAGVEGFTKTVAKELSKFGIRCNAILPGFIKTPMIETIPANVKAQILTRIPLGREGEPSEIAEACLFLACGKSSYITGISLEVTGGASL